MLSQLTTVLSKETSYDNLCESTILWQSVVAEDTTRSRAVIASRVFRRDTPL
jgi:hypothetical protein